MTGHTKSEMKKGNTGKLHSSCEKDASDTAKKGSASLCRDRTAEYM